MQSLFIEMGHPLPSESCCRSKVGKIASEETRVKRLLKDKLVFLVVDEAEVNGQKYLNILGGNIDTPTERFALVNSPLSDAAAYMNAAGRTLKTAYTRLFHVTCFSHLLHNCAENIRAQYKAVDTLISSTKSVTVKNSHRRNLFHEIGSPPTPILTRWGTWLDAAVNYYAPKLLEVRKIVESFEDDGVIVEKAKQAVKGAELDIQLAEITRCYASLLPLLKKMEAKNYSIFKAYSDLRALNVKDDKCCIGEYINRRLIANDAVDIINCSKDGISPDLFAKLQGCPPTSCAVERSFSLLKKLLAKDRNFLPENLSKYFTFMFNHSTQ